MRGFVEGLTPDYASLHPGYKLQVIVQQINFGIRMRIIIVSVFLATSFLGVLSAPRGAQAGVLEDAEFAGILAEVMYAATKCGKVASTDRLRILATLSGANIARVNRELSKAFQGKSSDPFIDKAAGLALNTIAADIKRRGQAAACKSLIESAAPLGLYDD